MCACASSTQMVEILSQCMCVQVLILHAPLDDLDVGLAKDGDSTIAIAPEPRTSHKHQCWHLIGPATLDARVRG